MAKEKLLQEKRHPHRLLALYLLDFKTKIIVNEIVDLPQVDSHNFFSGFFQISLNVFKTTSAEGAWNKNKPSAEEQINQNNRSIFIFLGYTRTYYGFCSNQVNS